MDWTTWRRGRARGRRAVLLDPFDGLDETGGGGDERHHGGEFIAAEGGVLLALYNARRTSALRMPPKSREVP